VKIIPKAGVLQNKVILPVIVERFFPVTDIISGKQLDSPFIGFSYWSLADITRMAENENSIFR